MGSEIAMIANAVELAAMLANAPVAGGPAAYRSACRR
jgi:hypothetical protein